MTYWFIKKIKLPVPTLSSGTKAWTITVKDRDSPDEAEVHYEYPEEVGPDYEEGVIPLMISGGYCPGDFGECE